MAPEGRRVKTGMVFSQEGGAHAIRKFREELTPAGMARFRGVQAALFALNTLAPNQDIAVAEVIELADFIADDADVASSDRCDSRADGGPQCALVAGHYLGVGHNQHVSEDGMTWVEVDT